VEVRFQGAIAILTVDRALPALAEPGRATESHLDVLPPEGGALLDVALATEAGWKPVGRGSEVTENAKAYDEALRAMGLERTPLDVDEDLRFRMRVAVPAHARRPSRLRYRLVCPVTVVDGAHLRLTVPADPDATPGLARLRVLAPAGGRISVTSSAAGPSRAGEPAAPRDTTVDLRGSWEVSLTLPPAPAAGTAPRVEGVATLGAAPRVSSTVSAPLAFSVRAHPSEALAPWPDLVLFVVDRSRSVGPAGLAVERDTLKETVERLPAGTRVQVVFFDRTARALFPAPRPATREVLTAIDEAMLPDTLANGSDFAAAAEVAGQVLRDQAALGTSAAWAMLLTDGAFQAPLTRAKLAAAFGDLGAVGGLHVAALAVRPREDAPFAPDTEASLRAFAGAARAPHVVRSFREDQKKEAVADLLADLRAGGELEQVALTSGRTDVPLPGTLSPSEARTGLLSTPFGDRPLPSAWSWSDAGKRARGAARVAVTDSATLAALAAPPRAGVMATPWLAVLVEPLKAPPPPPPVPPAAGSLERSVVRDHLSLRFLPRARACYQKRVGMTAALRDLDGRVRLGLDLARGELVGVEILGQSLGRGDDGAPVAETPAEKAAIANILTCLEEAAYLLDVPRTYMSDEGVRAVLNLHFRPYKQERRNELDEGLAGELDVMLEHARARTSAPEAAASPPAPSPRGP